MHRSLSLSLLSSLCFAACSWHAPAPSTPPGIQLEQHVVEFDTATVTLLSPGPLTEWPYTMSIEERSLLLNSDTRIYDQLPEIQVVVGWVRNREGFKIDLDGGFQGFMLAEQQSPGGVGLNYHSWRTSVSGLPAVRVTATNDASGHRAMESVFTGKNTEAWFITVYVAQKDKDVARRIIESVHVRAEVADQPDLPDRKVPLLKLSVTNKGEIYLDGNRVSIETVRSELEKLHHRNGAVMYYRDGGASPTKEAESSSALVLFEISRADVPFFFSEGAKLRE